jgi:hypothetical protein
MLRMVNDRADGSLTAGERDDRAWIINAARRARHQPPRIRCLCPGPTETDPVIEPPNAPLIDAVAAALAASTDRVVILSHAGRRYVAKRVAPQPRSRLQAVAVRWLVKGITGQSLPMQTLRLADAATGVGFEARRLRALEQAGQRVPHLVHEGPDYLLLEHCGNTVANLLEAWTQDTCRSEMENEARELSAFHRAGQWHGASQIKNLTRHDGHTWRIDFEEDFGELVPLPVVQALDIILFLNSVSLAGAVDEAESRRLLPRLLALCLEENPDARVRATLLRARPWVARLAWLSTPMRRRTVRGRQRKGALRLALLADALATLSDGP